MLFIQTGSFQNSKDPIPLPNYGLELPTDDEEEELLSQQNEVAADDVQRPLVIEAIEAENQLVTESEGGCQNDQLDYCTSSPGSGSPFKSSNHTMCKYCVRIPGLF